MVPVLQMPHVLITLQPHSLNLPLDLAQVQVQDTGTTRIPDVKQTMRQPAKVSAASVFRLMARHGAKTHQDRQGFNRMSQQMGQEISNTEWNELCTAGSPFHPFNRLTSLPVALHVKWIQSKAARQVICETLSGVADDDKRRKALEPPYMLPSLNPEDYSRVCTLHHALRVWLTNRVVSVVLHV